jgi:hypothetical protein
MHQPRKGAAVLKLRPSVFRIQWALLDGESLNSLGAFTVNRPSERASKTDFTIEASLR